MCVSFVAKPNKPKEAHSALIQTKVTAHRGTATQDSDGAGRNCSCVVAQCAGGHWPAVHHQRICLQLPVRAVLSAVLLPFCCHLWLFSLRCSSRWKRMIGLIRLKAWTEAPWWKSDGSTTGPGVAYGTEFSVPAVAFDMCKEGMISSIAFWMSDGTWT